MAATYINSHQLAQRWCMSPKTLDRWRCSGQGPKHLKVGGKILYRLKDIEDYEAQNMRSITRKSDGGLMTAKEMEGVA